MAHSTDAFVPRRYVRHGLFPQLVAFEAVLRHGSARRAAESLCIAAPTLSGHLRKLGEALGVKLFEHEGKRLVPTPAALALLGSAREIFSALARCEEEMAAFRTRPAASHNAPVPAPAAA